MPVHALANRLSWPLGRRFIQFIGPVAHFRVGLHQRADGLLLRHKIVRRRAVYRRRCRSHYISGGGERQQLGIIRRW